MGRKKQTCGNHSHEHLSPEEYENLAKSCTERVESALRIAAEQLQGERGITQTMIASAKVWSEIPGLGIKVTTVVVPRPSGQGRIFFSYTWDWLNVNSESVLADNLVAQVRKLSLMKVGKSSRGYSAAAEFQESPSTRGSRLRRF